MSSQEKEIEEQIEKSKEYSIKDAASVSITGGLGDNYISAYAVALGASPFQIGLLSSLPTLLGTFIQLFTSRLMEKISRKEILSKATLFQSLFWLPIIFVSIFYIKGISLSPLLLIIFYTIYAMLGNFASPAWVSWIGDLVKKEELGRFFGKRNSIAGICSLIGIVLGGLVLNFFQKKFSSKQNFVFFGFFIIFFLAMFFRLLSRYFVLKQYEPEFKFERKYYFSFKDFLLKAYQGDFGRFALFLAVFMFATNISAPFYTVYMLKDLQFSYFQFMMIIVSASIASVLFMPLWGKFIDEYGNIYTLQITSLMIPLICFLWPLSIVFSFPAKLYFLFLANFFSGFSWAGFNLACGNYLYESVSPQKRSLCTAYSSILNGLGIVLGASLGGYLVSRIKIEIINVIMFISIISGILRYLTALVFVPRLIEVREIKKKPSLRVVPLFSEILNLSGYLQNIFVVPIKIAREKIKKENS
jgi:MFS family permease